MIAVSTETEAALLERCPAAGLYGLCCGALSCLVVMWPLAFAIRFILIHSQFLMASPSALWSRIDSCLCKQKVREELGLSSQLLVQWAGSEKGQLWRSRREFRVMYRLGTNESSRAEWCSCVP